jgi:hypothetical protein
VLTVTRAAARIGHHPNRLVEVRIMAGEITPFRIDVPETDLADLRERLQRTRWPEAETVTDWSQGVPLAYLQDLCRYWATGYNWRATEARLNALPQFRTEIDGLSIHFIHTRSPHPDRLQRQARRARLGHPADRRRLG